MLRAPLAWVDELVTSLRRPRPPNTLRVSAAPRSIARFSVLHRRALRDGRPEWASSMVMGAPDWRFLTEALGHACPGRGKAQRVCSLLGQS
ncbi:hypothetical protein LX36DRAFT_314967 [Colletotrichum falcatum]|nr:hypothetical protein LX36DRAFT_314967 [Colletotrichum falcatum]